MQMFLEYNELVGLTGRKHRNAQRIQLGKMGIDFEKRADGLAVVLRAAIEKRLGLKEDKKRNQDQEPDLDDING